jgi:hypothetical protein
MRRRLRCDSVVELVTDYLEGALASTMRQSLLTPRMMLAVFRASRQMARGGQPAPVAERQPMAA